MGLSYPPSQGGEGWRKKAGRKERRKGLDGVQTLGFKRHPLDLDAITP